MTFDHLKNSLQIDIINMYASQIKFYKATLYYFEHLKMSICIPMLAGMSNQIIQTIHFNY